MPDPTDANEPPEPQGPTPPEEPESAQEPAESAAELDWEPLLELLGEKGDAPGLHATPDQPPPLPEPPPSPGPVLGKERIDSMDVLRGVAVLGILVMNIQSFSMPDPAYNNPITYGDLTGANYSVWYWSHVLAEFKFITIFSMLFGAGILVMRDRRIASGKSAAALHYRRMFILLVFGLIHGYFIWFGDILYAYALCGMVLYLFFWAPSWILIPLSIFCVWSAAQFAMDGDAEWPEDLRVHVSEAWSPSRLTIQDEIDIYQGSYAEQMTHRPYEMLRIHAGFVPYIALRVGGTILLGMGLHRLRFFAAAWPTWVYVSVLAIAGPVGLKQIIEGVHFNEAHHWAYPEAYFHGRTFNYWGSIPLSIAWVAAVMLVCKANVLHLVTRPFAAVGRMAFTNYLMHTAICTTIFYGHGFGLFGELERVEQFEVVVAIWLFQLIASPIWLSMFRFGPMEWLWRSLSYMRWQPMLVQRDATAADTAALIEKDEEAALTPVDEHS